MINPVKFARESYEEMQKVTWLPRKQMLGSTIAVLVLVTLVSVYISAADWLVAQFFGIFIQL